jgi:hypothetical protein
MRVTAIALAICSAATPALADDRAKADQLFTEAVKLRATDLERACAKFAEALAYNRQAIGALLNVALCHEQHGRIASAVALFGEARDRAREQQMAPELKEAEGKLAALRPELSYLTLDFAEPPAPGTRIVLDGRVVPLDETTEVPVDPGDRVVVVTAPGRVAYQTTLSIAKRQRAHAAVPRLGKAVVSSRRTIGLVAAGTGGAALIGGVVIGLVANARYQDQFDTGHCMGVEGAPRPRCDDVGQPAIESARTLGTVGTAVGVIGVVAIAAGAYLYLRAPRDAAAAKVSVVPHVSPASTGVAVLGRF